MKKVLSAILAAVVVISLAIPFATPAGAAERSESGLKLSDLAVDSYHKAKAN